MSYKVIQSIIIVPIIIRDSIITMIFSKLTPLAAVVAGQYLDYYNYAGLDIDSIDKGNTQT